jgi:hypothetical protein
MSHDPQLIDSRLTRQDGSEEVRVEVSRYRGHDYINIRKWWRGPDGTFLPGKGATLRITMLPWLRKAIEAAEGRALELGALAEEDFELAGLPLPPELTGTPA